MDVGGQFNRLVYPYFSEVPVLPEQGYRIGLTVLNKGFPNLPLQDFRVLDVLRGNSKGTVDTPLVGNEYEFFLKQYESLLTEWKKLRSEYE